MQQQNKTQTVEHKCPYCKINKLETTATAPYVRGFLLAYEMGSKTFIGCVSCVRKKTLGEAGLSILIGWFSITAFIINPFLIIYNFLQGLFMSAKPLKVKAKLRELGIPDKASAFDLNEVGYILATLMIKADGKVEEQEIAVAEAIGEKIFPEFDEARFRLIINSEQKLPTLIDIATLLNSIMDENGKKTIFQYLTAIAKADGNIDQAEKQMITQMALLMNIDLQSLIAQKA